MASRLNKSPDARLNFGVDWNKWLEKGDSLKTAEWTSESTDLTIEDSFVVGTVSSCYISGGVEGKTYILKVTIETTKGLIDSRLVVLQCQTQTV